MNRRGVLKSLGIIAGGTFLTSDLLLRSCTFFNNEQGILTFNMINLLEDIAETILPKTKGSPGAKDAEVGKIINAIVTDFYNKTEQKEFLEGLNLFKQDGFTTMSENSKEAYLLKTYRETVLEEGFIVKERRVTDLIPFFTKVKQLTVWAYLCSEIVATSVFNYLPIPGKYEACIEVDKDEKPMYWNPDPSSILF